MNSEHPNILPKVGISACLLGHEVRYDGGHKRDRFLTELLSPHVEFVALCPETGIGLGTPRPPIRLVGEPDRPLLVGVQDQSLDLTEKMVDYAKSQLKTLPPLCGYVLKKDSPSCGMERVKVYAASGNGAVRKGSGIFARILMAHHPLLPVEEEGRLNDAVLRENFVNRIYVYQRWLALLESGVTAANLIEFHSAHKYLLMAHSQAAYKRMGRMLSDLSGSRAIEVLDEYGRELMTALKRRANRKHHVNVLQHILGYLKQKIDGTDKAELVASIESYRRGETPLIVPITLLRHYFRKYPDNYMEKQYYLAPHPARLGLRNAI